jgi:hypothetical protein
MRDRIDDGRGDRVGAKRFRDAGPKTRSHGRAGLKTRNYVV